MTYLNHLKRATGMSLACMVILGFQAVALAGAQETAGQDPPPVQASEPKAKDTMSGRVHIVIDRFREVSGEVIKSDDASITIKREGRTETYERNKILAIVPLMEPKAGGEHGVVYMRDGSGLEGLVLSDGFDEVVIEVEGIRHRVPRTDVDHVELYPGFEEWLTYARSKIRPEDLEARIELAKWMMENKRLQLAREELTAIIAIDDHPEARQLLELTEVRIELENEGTENPTPMPPKQNRTEGLPKRQLTAEDVNIIRVFEIDFRNPPKVSLGPRVIDDLIAQHADHPLIPNDAQQRKKLFSLHDIDQVKLIFDVKARELYPRILVESIPHSLALFRKNVHNAWLIRNCATSGCHGGQNSGRFFLHRADATDSRTILENLLILERLDIEGPYKLVDYENPEMSLLVQYAMPQTESRVPHPDVPGFKAVFPSGKSRIRTNTENWIRSMYQPRPKYPVDYIPPTQVKPLETPAPPRVPR
ncbi:MAG: hypothetical protein P8J45_05925 [Phycisphaerales bacterium]|nr:hypothetical protein [Phycisphaerales bacterium]